MMHTRGLFYLNTISRWIPDRNSSVLIVAGGKLDRDVFSELNFKNVVISNLDSTIPAENLVPFTWSHQNIETLTYRDQEFDYVVVHAGLHHCHSPHRGLLEMYRVARKAAIAIEPPDNILVRSMQRFGLAQIYEYIAVQRNDNIRGGVDNSQIPNYVYRWTENEIEKVISSYDPIASHRYCYAYGSDEPFSAFIANSKVKRIFIAIAKPIYYLFGKFFPNQQNLFAFYIEKPALPQNLQPWLILEEGQIRYNPGWKKK